jgi:hypothetical protein
MVGVVVVSNEEELRQKVRELKREANHNHFVEDDVYVNDSRLIGEAWGLVRELDKFIEETEGWLKHLKSRKEEIRQRLISFREEVK